MQRMIEDWETKGLLYVWVRLPLSTASNKYPFLQFWRGAKKARWHLCPNSSNSPHSSPASTGNLLSRVALDLVHLFILSLRLYWVPTICWALRHALGRQRGKYMNSESWSHFKVSGREWHIIQSVCATDTGDKWQLWSEVGHHTPGDIQVSRLFHLLSDLMVALS